MAVEAVVLEVEEEQEKQEVATLHLLAYRQEVSVQPSATTPLNMESEEPQRRLESPMRSW